MTPSKTESSDVRALRKVLNEINTNVTAIRSNAKNFVSNAIVAGQLLTKIKAATKYGDWTGFLESVQLSYNTASRYMDLWERRTAIDLNSVKSLSDAEEMIVQLCQVSKRPLFQGIEKPTSQNQGVTHDKSRDSEAKPSTTNWRSVHGSGNSIRTKETRPQAAARTSSFDHDPRPRGDSIGAYVNEKDPADRLPQSTREDVIVARAVVLPASTDPLVFPHPFTIMIEDQDEEDFMQICAEKLLVKREKKNRAKKKTVPRIDMKDAIIKVKAAYKRIKGREMSVKGLDASQLRRHLESGMKLDEFLSVAEKAWVSKGWWARNQSHQLSTFVKHFGTIREENDNPNPPTTRDAIMDLQKNAGGLKGQAYADSVQTIGS